MSDFLIDPSNRARDEERKRLSVESHEISVRERIAEEDRQARRKIQAEEIAAGRAEERRRQVAERRDADLRRNFFTANPGATDADWQRLAPQIRDAAMTEAAAAQPANIYDEIRAKAEARRQAAIDRRDRLARFTVGAEETTS